MQRLLAVAAVIGTFLALAGPAAAAGSSSIAALQVALRAQGQPVSVDGLDGPQTRDGLVAFQRGLGLSPTGHVGPATRSALGPLGKPLLGQRELSIGAVGWDVSALEFGLTPFGLRAKAVDGRFTAETAKALRRFQGTRGLVADGVAGRQTFRALAGGAGAVAAFAPPVPVTHVVRAGENLTTIAARYSTSPLRLAKASGLDFDATIFPGQRLTLPAGAQSSGTAGAAPSKEDVRASIDHWSSVYGVDPGLARATAWMESGFQHNVVSSVGAIGVMQLLPTTWTWVDQDLLGTITPRTYDGNIRAGVRYLRWLLDQFQGDRRLALAAYYQGAQAVRDRGLFDDTKRYVAVILKLHGSV